MAKKPHVRVTVKTTVKVGSKKATNTKTIRN